MASISLDDLPLIVIVGPTASGKTSLGIHLAKKYDGEIISADSRSIYRGLDIGTAKPTMEERDGVPHWGIDLVDPGDRFTASDFKKYTIEKIAEIRGRGRVPFIVGGTGLYVDSVLLNYQFGPDEKKTTRDKWKNSDVNTLLEYCIQNNIEVPENNKNKRYLIRAIEQKGINKKRSEKPISNSIIVGITTNRDILRERIADRSKQIFNNSVVNEAINISNIYGWESEAMTGNVYPLIHKYLDNEMTLEEARAKFITLDWRLAKRQLTWFRRNKFIYWGDVDSIERYIEDVFDHR